MTKQVAVITPVFNEAGTLREFYVALTTQLNSLAGVADFSLIFVDDGSTDGSRGILEQLAVEDPAVTVIFFSRNFGKEAATTAGLRYAADVDAAIVLDSDLEHPPEIISRMIDRWSEGAEVVCAIRSSWSDQSLIRRLGSHVFNSVMKRVSEVPMLQNSTDFRLYSRNVLESFQSIAGEITLVRATFDWLGFEPVLVEFDAPRRNHSRSKFRIRNLVGLAVSSLMAFSLLPLRLTAYLGLVTVVFSGLLLTWMVLAGWVFKVAVYTPLALFMVFNTFLVGVVLGAIGLMALYIGSIHTKVSRKPQYVIKSICGKVRLKSPQTRG